MRTLRDVTTGMRRAELLLRAGTALCFIGHGMFGVLRKPAWLGYFDLFGVDAATAHVLMPLVGVLDITIGLLVLAWPARVVFAYAAVWCLFTALLRPLNGEGVAEALERAGNYGVPLALLVWVGLRADAHGWLRRIRATQLEPQRTAAVLWVCRITAAALLAGHGMLALSGKPLLQEHVQAVGLTAGATVLVGLADLVLAAVCLLTRSAGALALVAAWKVATEALFIVSGAPIWEFIERGGSYAAPLVAAVLLATSHVGARVQRTFPAPRAARAGAAVLTLALLPGALAAQQRPAVPPFDVAHAEQLRSGGYVLACRHGTTDAGAVDRSPVDFDDASTQRRLNEAGERQMREAGGRIAAAGIPFSEVMASPYQRTRRSAELMFGSVVVDSALYGSGRESRRRALFVTPPAPGTNRALVTHQGVLYPMLGVPRGTIDEGDCIMIRPDGEGFVVVARITPADWSRAVTQSSAQPPRSIRPGSTPAARRAGSQLAKTAAPSRTNATPTRVTGSVVVTL